VEKNNNRWFSHSFPLMNEPFLFSFLPGLGSLSPNINTRNVSFIHFSPRSVDMFCAVVFEECPIRGKKEKQFSMGEDE
jgi:hypothetical protein